MELEHLRQWIGRTERSVDRVDVARVVQLAATLDRDDVRGEPGEALLPLWHWMFFAPAAPASQLGPDGHPRRGGFLPPVPLPRRMWAGGRLSFEHPLRVGDDIARDSRIADVSGKQGRSGSLVFVTVAHEISDARGVAIREEHDIVYRDEPKAAGAGETKAASAGAAKTAGAGTSANASAGTSTSASASASATPVAAAPARPEAAAPAAPRTDEQFSRRIAPDPVLLFRYSAVTFNGHRIHYDRSYVTGVEGYPGLVVHGPLIATLLLDLLHRERPAARVARFEFKAVRPLFDLHAFEVCGRAAGERSFDLWARDHEGRLAMQASAELHRG
ncbi:MAG: MaoC family dehydratase N-terminal domain-containing protein [Burkholderiaceae bacterium]|nr:MaoC family dehydratase N-terminal domain-containing protein [Burkholderiaceae bacterium]